MENPNYSIPVSKETIDEMFATMARENKRLMEENEKLKTAFKDNGNNKEQEDLERKKMTEDVDRFL